MNGTEQLVHRTVTEQFSARLSHVETLLEQLIDEARRHTASLGELESDTDRADLANQDQIIRLWVQVDCLARRISALAERPNPRTVWERVRWLVVGR